MVCRVDRGTTDTGPVVGRLDDGVLLSVDPTAEFMSFTVWDVQLLPNASGLIAVR